MNKNKELQRSNPFAVFLFPAKSQLVRISFCIGERFVLYLFCISMQKRGRGLSYVLCKAGVGPAAGDSRC
ncbi:MAG: hypothetical protein IKT25_00960, partial [Firmicutes bacterium]|nr:hypothetical protein [Bacillota bacterium]